MSQTKFDICSRALVRAGCNPIAAFPPDETTAEAITAGREYEPLVEGELCKAWRFAVNQAELVRLVETPLARWDAFYQLPGDLLELRGIREGEVPIDFDRYGDRIACDTTGVVIADYIYRVPETKFPPLFREALVIRLEAVFLRGIKRNLEAAADRDGAADDAFAIARTSDAQQQTPRRAHKSRLVVVRQ